MSASSARQHSSNTEYRLFHRPEFIQHGLAYDPHQPGLVVSLSGEDGSAPAVSRK